MRDGPTTDEEPSPSTTADALAETMTGTRSQRTRPSSDSDDELEEPSGDRIGRYRLVRLLGAGGMGMVHLAHDDQLDRPVALKVLRPDGNGDSRRLLREARSMARLSHPHIAAVYDVGTHDGDVYVAMEYVEGPTLRKWMETPRSWDERRDVLVQAARGLTAAHASGVIHRDFKPENVIVAPDGRVRVLDFGLAKLAPRTTSPHDESTNTQLGAIVGTPRYMAPEQLRGKPAGPAADQFAFSVTAYELAYGQRPFDGENFADVAASVLTQPPHDPPNGNGVPDALWPVLQRGMQIDQAARHPDMQALTEALEQVTGAPQPEPEPAAAPVVSRPDLRDAQEQARKQLTQAYADDLLDADEIDQRLEQLENASDLPVVAALVADLAPASAPAALALPTAAQQPSGTALAVPQSSVPAVTGVSEKADIIAVFSGTRRAGVWTPARVNRVFCVFGGTELDLREANLPPGEIEIQVLILMGGLEITVPPGTRVELECTAIMGGAEQEDASAPLDPNATTVRVTGFVMFGGVEVCERLPGESGWAARKRRKAHRRALREARKNKALPPGQE